MDRKRVAFGLIVLFGVSAVVSSLQDFVGKNSNGKRSEYLDSNGLYLVEWEAFTDTQTIVFELTVKTTGFIGFGISPTGGMTGADIIIGGVYQNGSAYISNRHGVGNQMPEIDDTETWELLKASENGTHTYLKVGRLLNTCVSQDVPIGNSTSNFIWSFGKDDVIAYHTDNRGTSSNNILDPAMTALDTTNFQLWRMTNTMVMPTKATTYWCTIQKSPSLPSKHQIIGFRPVLETPAALKYTHHFIVQKCRHPKGSTDEETFERFVGQPGADCHGGSFNILAQYCADLLFIWAVGGKTVTLPEHVGYPFAEDGKDTYYMLEVHLDNPNNVEGVTFESGVDIFYTPELRPYDAGVLASGYTSNWALTIPPKSEDYVIVGHCSPTCTSNIPAAGINVFNILLHSHLAGRKLRLRHYRNGEELPWLSSDDNYNFNYQQNRPLLEEVKLLPGDHLINECTYNSMDANGTIVGGASTSEEMCNTYLWYYPKIDLGSCRSVYPTSELMKYFGIESVEQSVSWLEPIVTAPENMAGKPYTEVLNTMIPWTKENRDHFQQEIRYDPVGLSAIEDATSKYGEHDAICRTSGRVYSITGKIKYPNTTNEYAPIDECVDKCVSTDDCVRGRGNKQSSLYFMTCILAMVPFIPWF